MGTVCTSSFKNVKEYPATNAKSRRKLRKSLQQPKPDEDVAEPEAPSQTLPVVRCLPTWACWRRPPVGAMADWRSPAALRDCSLPTTSRP
jgi:hypothetical protein